MKQNVRVSWKEAMTENAVPVMNSVLMLLSVAGKAATPAGLKSSDDVLGAFIMSGLGITLLTVVGIRSALQVRAVNQAYQNH